MKLSRKSSSSISIKASLDEFKIFANTLNEALVFVPITEFFARFGCSVNDVKVLSSKLQSILSKQSRNDEISYDFSFENVVILSQVMNAVCHRVNIVNSEKENVKWRERCYILLDELLEWIDNNENPEE